MHKDLGTTLVQFGKLLRNRHQDISRLSAVLVFAAMTSGCWSVAGNGKILASARVGHPIDDVLTTSGKALAKLEELEKSGKLDPGAITTRANYSFEDVARMRGAIAAQMAPDPTVPEIPGIPDADRGTLHSDRFSDPDTAAALSVAVSPFHLISGSQDIYDSLIPAELRFKFDSLRAEGYQFYHVPITVAVQPGSRTESGYMADVRFELDFHCGREPESVPTSMLAEVLARRLVFCALVEDERVFTISPLRQLDARAESLATRIQREEALLGRLSGVLNATTTAAVQGQVDRLRRLETEFATITEQPRVTGYVDEDLAFGWRIYPTVRVNDKGKATGSYMGPGPRDLLVIVALRLTEHGKTPLTAEYLEKQVKDSRLYRSIAYVGENAKVGNSTEPDPLKNLDDELSEALREVGCVPGEQSSCPENLNLVLYSEARWVKSPDKFFGADQLRPENSPQEDDLESGKDDYWLPERGAFIEVGDSIAAGSRRLFSSDYGRDDWHGYGYLEVSLRVPPMTDLTATGLDAPKSGVKDTPQMVTIEGSGFSGSTRVVVNGLILVPLSVTPKMLTVAIDPSKFPPGKKPYSLLVTDGPRRIAIVGQATPRVLEIVGPVKPPTPTVTIVGDPGEVAPGDFVELLYATGDPSRPASLKVKDTIKIRMATSTIASTEIEVLDAAKARFGFTVPRIAEGVSGRVSTVVSVGGTPMLVTPSLHYVAPPPPPKEKDKD